MEVSQLLKWPGKLTGIPRTMDEMARRFKDQDAIFLDWDPAAGVFFETELPDIKTVNQNSTEASQAQGVKQKIKNWENDSRVGKHAVGLARKSLHKARQMSSKSKPVNDNAYKPLAGDVVFIAWGEAIDNDYIDALVSLRNNGAKIVQLAHDMIPIVTPQFAGHTTDGLTRYATKVFPICSTIIANSKNTAKDVEAWLIKNNLPKPPIKVIRLGDDYDYVDPITPHEDSFKRSGLKGNDFILSVGTFESRKNHTLYYYVYKLAKEKGIELPKLVIVGRRGWKTENLHDFISEDPETKDQIVFLHEADDNELSWLYDNCLFTTYVSFYEGWGLPIAESIMRGVPCISSNTSSMTEVADGKAYAYINPASTDECLSAIQKLLDPSELAKARKSIADYEPYSWEKTFQATYIILKEV